MKRVCTLRKVLFSVSKVLLEKLFFIVLKYRGFYRHSVLIVFIISPAGRYAMEWKGNPKYLHEKSFSKFYCNICHTYINLLVYNGLMVAVDPISIITLLSPIATP